MGLLPEPGPLVTATRDAASGDIVEGFTFRANGREVSVSDVVVEPAAPRTRLAASVAAALALRRDGRDDAIDLGVGGDPVHPCIVAWTDYEVQGYCSLLSVVRPPNAARTIVGADFLTPRRLRLDVAHGGLVGWAPPDETPLTGGGYVVGVPRGEVLERSAERFEAAASGEVLRPHPAWRSSVPAGLKTHPTPADRPSAASEAVGRTARGAAGAGAAGAGGPERKRICEWRPPVAVPLATLAATLRDAIAVAEQRTRVDPSCHLH